MLSNIRYIISICLLGITAWCRSQPAELPPARPNIVLILADDLGYGDVGFNGQRKIKTPHIDRLAEEGMKFTQFYAGTTVCAPSRSVLLSGQHSGRTYIRGNLGVKPEGQLPIPDSMVTIAEVLREAGYTTGAFGKWGLGPVGSSGDPNKQGFDRFYGYNCQTQAHRYYPSHLWDNDQKVLLTENGEREFTKQYAPDMIQEKALAFIADAGKENRPFFLFLPYILPHAELIAPEDSLLQQYRGQFQETPFQGEDYGKDARVGGYASQPYPRAAFAAMVGRLDHYVGQVLDKLKSEGLDRNTLVLFTSDNGPHREGGADPDFFNSGGGFRGYKRDLYEGGIREPFVAWWPGQIQAGSVNPHIGAFWDLMPTFSALAGVSAPANIDGISFVPALLKTGNQGQHDFLYWEFHEGGGAMAVRKGYWKAVIRNVDEGIQMENLELYRLDRDPKESHDVKERFPKESEELLKLAIRSHERSERFPFAYERKQK